MIATCFNRKTKTPIGRIPSDSSLKTKIMTAEHEKEHFVIETVIIELFIYSN